MSLLYTLKERPAKIYFYAAIIVLSLFGVLGRMTGETKSVSEQSDLEQLFRIHTSLIVKVMPFFLVYAFVYWLMYKNGKPTHPKLNYLHFGMVVITMLVTHIFFRDVVDAGVQSMDHVITGMTILTVLVFGFNILMSMMFKDFGR